VLDTKLKNRHKLAVVLIICTILLPAFYVTSQYQIYNEAIVQGEAKAQKEALISEEFLEQFLETGYILYNRELDREDTDEVLENDFQNILSGFQWFYPYLDYRVEDEEGNVVDFSTVNTGNILKDTKLSDYEFALVVAYDSKGNPSIKMLRGEYEEDQRIVIRRLLNSPESYETYELLKNTEDYGLERPAERTYYYAMDKENLQDYLEEGYYHEDYLPYYAVSTLLLLMFLVAGAAWIYPLFRSLRTGQEKIFTAPFEVAAIIAISVSSMTIENYAWMIEKRDGVVWTEDYAYWILVFGAVYWASSCFRQIYVLGPADYLKKRSLLYASGKYVKRIWRWLRDKVTKLAKRIYESFQNVDLSEENNKIIFKIVLVNFCVLAVLCSLWFFGIAALVIYSVLLFLFLQKYYRDLQKKYAVLLDAVNQIADGNLDVEITGDLGVFSPFRTEITKIQTGFKKAVEEEVKSQRMKTELITNVSHDLKTPLTAIITYVNLLKEEKDGEKQKAYIEVLESKSLRLKALIEDLFEISKVSSKNVNLHIVDVDIVNLFKQVKLELEDKFQAADIDFRCKYPNEKLIVPLDSQKTYRIFENLLVNISKYAMPHTRAYVEIGKEGTETVIHIKNISAEEITFNPEEITERFVRGDVSRNTEGSGLGLAIAKSFTELQKGKFKIETEADLFKVEIRF